MTTPGWLKWLYYKKNVFGCVRDTIVRWERQTGRQVKIILSHNGTEFKAKLDDFFWEKKSSWTN